MKNNYKKECKYEKRLIAKLQSLPNSCELDFVEIRKAIYCARKYHEGQKRKTGEPFYSHPIEVAYMVSDYLPKTHIIIASILHDIIEDTEMTKEMRVTIFGNRVGQIVDMLTRDRPDGTKLSVEQILHNAYQAKDKEVLLIKFIDRLHNLSTMAAMLEAKQLKQIEQSLKHLMSLATITEMHEISYLIYKECQKNNLLNKRIESSDFTSLAPNLKNLY